MITAKRSGKPIVRTRRVRQIAREIAGASRHLILLYGGGSFGHPLAHQYKLSGKVLSKSSIVGIAKTISAMRTLGNALADIFLAEGVPVVPLQTSSFVREQKGRLIITNHALIEDILSHGGVPMFGGDVVIADRRRTVIASADRLAAELARHFRSHNILFATDVDGVYKKFPARANELPLSVILRKELKVMAAKKIAGKNSLDVTGAMGGKLRALLSLRNCTVTIFNGLCRGVLCKVLRGEAQGTRIVL